MFCEPSIGWKYNVTIKDGQFKKKSTQVSVDNPDALVDNDYIQARIHDFRHSHASLLINQGEDYLVVKERLGHASITTTIDTYSHLYPSKQQKLADKLDDLL